MHHICNLVRFGFNNNNNNKKAQLTQGLRATAPSFQDGGCSKMAVSRHLGFYRTANSNYASISYRFRDIAAYWSKIATPLYLAPPLGVTPPDLRNDPWCRKNRMMGLSDRDRISMIRSAVLIQYTRVTDGRRTDGIGVAYTRYSIYAVARKNATLKHKKNIKTCF